MQTCATFSLLTHFFKIMIMFFDSKDLPKAFKNFVAIETVVISLNKSIHFIHFRFKLTKIRKKIMVVCALRNKLLLSYIQY